jgi:hypothetical protein
MELDYINAFDANADWIECGEDFFAEVHHTEGFLEQVGLKSGDIVLCQHVEKLRSSVRRNVKTLIFKDLKSCPIIVTPAQDHEWSMLVFSGRPDGTGFINDEWKQKALNFLGGEWNND